MSTEIATALIDAAQAATYHADGFLVVRRVFSPERIAELDLEAQRLRARSDLIDPNNIRCRWQNQHDTEFRGWLQDRCAEYGKTATFFR